VTHGSQCAASKKKQVGKQRDKKAPHGTAEKERKKDTNEGEYQEKNGTFFFLLACLLLLHT
jgi:hypothetical protein